MFYQNKRRRKKNNEKCEKKKQFQFFHLFDIESLVAIERAVKWMNAYENFMNCIDFDDRYKGHESYLVTVKAKRILRR